MLSLRRKTVSVCDRMVCVAVKGQPVIGVRHKPFLESQSRTFWAWVDTAKSSNLEYVVGVLDYIKLKKEYVVLET